MPRRPHSQVFLHDARVASRFAALIPAVGDAPVVEIGPGRGAITSALVAGGHRVVAVEVDPRLASQLPTFGGNVEVITGSILDLAPSQLTAPPARVIGALPYHLSGAILRWLADGADSITVAAVMLQEEVVARMGAPPGDRARGLLSVVLQSVYAVKPLFRVSPGAFVPAPRVWSRAVLLTRLAGGGPVVSYARIWDLARALFGQRRKMIRTSLAQTYGPEACARAAAIGVDLTLRAERLSLPDLETLVTAITPGS